ncbi:MAG: hypothetical protein J5887_02950 [Erysipelotrichaceae bacterium]|nr:hypothetical protein [Erysipelotrichaceae bacterium]
MSNMFETGIGLADHVKVEVWGTAQQPICLTVNPVGQFNPGGCLALASVRKDQVLQLKSTEELYDFLTRKIFFENLETAIPEEECNYTLKGVLDYTENLAEDDENSWWLPYFRTLAEDVNNFREKLMAAGRLEELQLKVHQYHAAAGELCDFADWTCFPEGGDEDEVREFLEDSLAEDLDADEVMELFEDGYFQGSGFEGDECVSVDFAQGTCHKKLVILAID